MDQVNHSRRVADTEGEEGGQVINPSPPLGRKRKYPLAVMPIGWRFIAPDGISPGAWSHLVKKGKRFVRRKTARGVEVERVQ